MTGRLETPQARARRRFDGGRPGLTAAITGGALELVRTLGGERRGSLLAGQRPSPTAGPQYA
jgi:hypothetical protein